MFLPAAILAASPTLARLARPATQQTVAAAGITLGHASAEWSNRKPDERFWTVADAVQAAEARDNRLSLADVRADRLTIAPRDNAPALVDIASGHAARISNVALGQICRNIGAPVGYIETLPADLASSCLSEGWAKRMTSADPIRLQVLDARSDLSTIRALTSTTHDLTHDSQILRALLRVITDDPSWKLPPGRKPCGYEGQTRNATEADCLRNAGVEGLAVKPGDEIAPSGCYVGDRDMFCLLVDDGPRGGLEMPSADGRPARALSRFLTIGNCEVAQGKLEITTGWMDGVCGNHYLWNCRDIVTVSAVHRGNNASRSVHKLAYQIQSRGWTDDRAETAAHFAAMRLTKLADNKADLIDLLFSKKITTRANAENAASVAEELSHIDGAPGFAWATMTALTRLSQVSKHHADRVALDTAAAKVAAMVRN